MLVEVDSSEAVVIWYVHAVFKNFLKNILIFISLKKFVLLFIVNVYCLFVYLICIILYNCKKAVFS
jgi:hypothetical protein